jgi:hypothetical protein
MLVLWFVQPRGHIGRYHRFGEHIVSIFSPALPPLEPQISHAHRLFGFQVWSKLAHFNCAFPKTTSVKAEW